MYIYISFYIYIIYVYILCFQTSQTQKKATKWHIQTRTSMLDDGIFLRSQGFTREKNAAKVWAVYEVENPLGGTWMSGWKLGSMVRISGL